MKTFQTLFMLFAFLCMSTMIAAEGHTNSTDVDHDDHDHEDDDNMMKNDTMSNETMTMDDDMSDMEDIPVLVSSAGRLGAMASVAAIVAGTFVF